MMDTRALETALPAAGEAVTFAGVPEGMTAPVLADAARLAARAGRVVLHVAPADVALARLAAALSFFAPDVPVLRFPAWDCTPYDRTSPSAAIVAQRMAALAALAARRERGEAGPLIVLTTVNAASQRTVPPAMLEGATLHLRPGMLRAPEELAQWLAGQGYVRTGTVMGPGEFAPRGGILDLFAPGADGPVRLDFFGDELESIRRFDIETQRSTRALDALSLQPAREVVLTDEAIARFRTGYVEAFGGEARRDPLYEAVTAGRMQPGMEHWLALFHEELATLFDHVGAALVTLDHEVDAALSARLEDIADYHRARLDHLDGKLFGADPYRPLPPDALYLNEAEWTALLAARPVARLSPFTEAEGGTGRVIDMGGRAGRGFAAERAQEGVNVFEAARDHIAALRQDGRKVLLAGWTDGSRERLVTILSDHGLSPIAPAASWREAREQGAGVVSAVRLEVAHGFVSADLALVTEQDILGDRLIRRTKKRRRAADVIRELTALDVGDLVVHVDHGIGRFEGLKTITADGAAHDCLHLTYAGGDTLYLPVENIDLLTRYGGEEATAQLDRLGGSAWQAKKAKLKKRLLEMAGELIATAAKRAMRRADVITVPEGMWEEFCARFPHEETEDQLKAVEDVLADLASGRPMDRLICGDVGFGKTEVALRAAFAAVMSGKQVAVITPTTLLARQHFATFRERFAGWPVKVAMLSRMVPAKEQAAVKKALKAGEVDIVIGTHALLGRDIALRDLGLLVIDEEQHFGVRHKERLKALKADVHVLTLTATPIPRTLQLALSGVRELSVIATPPADRLAVRTFLSPFDPVSIREALLREHYRGGQSYYVVPRIADLDEVARFLREQVPEVRFATAHGRMTPAELDRVMTDFHERRFDVLLATTIIESGLDITNANTMIVHRADMFGLAQLYQLRGRIGRGKVRGWCLLTVPRRVLLSAAAKKRLEVLLSLDTLGAGFMLASHDLDIRGAGNLLGEEQSGHIKEVGFALYQQMLEEAVAELKGEAEERAAHFSPAINIGAAVLIPERYVPDLQTRLGLYRRLAEVESETEVEAFAAELRDRFGPPPEEARHLLEVVTIRMLARAARVAALEAGAKGAVLRFHEDTFPNPEKLVGWIAAQGAAAKLRPDMRLVVMRDWESLGQRVAGLRKLLRQLAALAG